MIRSLSIAFFCLVLAGSAAPAAETVLSPGMSIQAAIDAAADGDVIVLEPGTYGQRFDLKAKSIVVRSIAGPSETTVDATGLEGPVVRCVATQESAARTAKSAVIGLTLTGGTGDTSSNVPKGGGVYLERSSTTFVSCIIRGNTARVGGGVCTVNGRAQPRFQNCVLVGNRAETNGGAVYADLSQPRFDNCSIVWNDVNGSGGGVQTRDELTLVNTVVSGNTDSGEVEGADQVHEVGSRLVVARHCAIAGGWEGVAIIDGDLLLPRGSWNPGAGSPLIDGGDASELPPDLFDLDGDDDTTEGLPLDVLGNQRVLAGSSGSTGAGIRIDIGAVEFRPGEAAP